jgi:hypothetical protein
MEMSSMNSATRAYIGAPGRWLAISIAAGFVKHAF